MCKTPFIQNETLLYRHPCGPWGCNALFVLQEAALIMLLQCSTLDLGYSSWMWCPSQQWKMDAVCQKWTCGPNVEESLGSPSPRKTRSVLFHYFQETLLPALYSSLLNLILNGVFLCCVIISGSSAKVAPASGANNKAHLICIYTEDHEDVADVFR